MISRWMRAAALLALAPAAALAFEAVDIIPFPSFGAFPAYPRETAGPFEFWAQGGVMRDDNALRRPTGEQTENIVRYGAGVRGEARVIGRQSVLLEAVGEYYDYDRFSSLDHFAYGLLAEWLWELGNQLSDTLGYSRRRFQADLSESQAAVRDLITGNRYYGTAAYRFAADWRLRGGFEYADFSRPTRTVAETQVTSLTAGIDYVTPLTNAIGLEYRTSHGDAPVSEEIDPSGVFASNDFREQELAAVLAYALGTQLRVRGRIGRTERSYSDFPGRDFNGTTWRAGVEWLPGAKTRLVLETYKEPRSVIDIAAHHVVRRGVLFGPSWAPLAKLVLYARLGTERRVFQGDPAAVALGTPLLDETVRTLRFGVGWEPQRHWQLGTALDRGERTSNTLGRDYKFTALILNLRYSF